MNLFQLYGIKEVADVTFYSITKIGDEEFYLPVLFLDTLKVSTMEQKSDHVSVKAGYANQKIIAWNVGKDITLRLEDALFSPASMNMTFGYLSSDLAKYTSAIAKINQANRYAALHYSIYAHPSPELTEEEWEVIFFSVGNAWEKNQIKDISKYTGKDFDITNKSITKKFIENDYVAEIRTLIKQRYYKRTADQAIPEEICNYIYDNIKYLSHISSIDTDTYALDVVDRFERCYAPENGLTINVQQQYNNIKAYFNNDKTHSFVIYYDEKTMQPLLLDSEGNLINKFNTDTPVETVTLKPETGYLKFTRTVVPRIDEKSILGKTLSINSTVFPGQFKIVGETYIREQATQTDERYQFVINRAVISTDTNIDLKADGDPTTFSMGVDVLSPPNENMVELRQFNVEEDKFAGGTKIVPQSANYSYTLLHSNNEAITSLVNNEIY